MNLKPPYQEKNIAEFCQLRDAVLDGLINKPLIMGILNVTPDSFSDGGLFFNADEAFKHAIEMHEQGADIIDIGAESTRPGSTPIDAETEWQRLAPLFKELTTRLPQVPVSIDTYKADIAAKTLNAGAVIVNDVSGLQHDPAMADTIAEHQAGVIIMHSREEADETIDIMDDIENFFTKSLNLASKAGIPRRHIILDPGIGFHKVYEQNFTILNELKRLKAFGLPLLIGLSRKRFIGRLLHDSETQRLVGTLTANLFALSQGARIIRVHDVAEHAKALKMFSSLERGYP